MSALPPKKYPAKSVADEFYSAEIILSNLNVSYRLKLKNVDGGGASFLISEDSAILKQLEVGKMLEMRFWIGEKTKSVEFVNATVKHIEKQNNATLKEHYLIRLAFHSIPGFDSERQKKAEFQSLQKSKDSGERCKDSKRRTSSENDYAPERRSGFDRRSWTDRRSGIDRRSPRKLTQKRSQKS